MDRPLNFYISVISPETPASKVVIALYIFDTVRAQPGHPVTVQWSKIFLVTFQTELNGQRFNIPIKEKY